MDSDPMDDPVGDGCVDGDDDSVGSCVDSDLVDDPISDGCVDGDLVDDSVGSSVGDGCVDSDPVNNSMGDPDLNGICSAGDGGNVDVS